MVRLGDVCALLNGRAYNKDELLKTGKTPVLRVGNFFSNREWYYSDLDLEPEKYCDNGDLLYAWSASFGPKIWDGPKVIYHYHIWKVLLSDNIDKNYLYYLFHRLTREIMESGHGITMIHTTKSSMENRMIPLPPLEIQQKIADVLDRANALIEKRKAQIDKLDLLVKSRFFEMFGDPVTNPMGWEVVNLSEVTSKIGSGATPRGGQESYVDVGISLIRSMNVYNGYFKYDALAHITDRQARQLDNVEIHKNDVLLNITGASVARSCLVPEDVLPSRVNQHVSIIRCNSEKLNCVFANAVLINDSYQRYLLSLGEAGGATRQAITKQQIENLKIILPSLDLQNRFAEFVDAADKSKFKMRKSLQKMELNYKSLIQKCFRGEIF